MKRWKRTFVEAAAILAIAIIAAFTHNAVSVNGINPFKQLRDIPVVIENSAEKEIHKNHNGIVFIDLERAKSFFEEGTKIIDARTPDAYAEGHIPGALLIDYYELGRYLDRVLPLLSMDEDIMVYCSGINCEDSELLARELYTMGFTKIFVYKGGFEEWEASGMPVEKGSPEKFAD